MATQQNNVGLLTQDPSTGNQSAVIDMAGGGPTSQRPGNPPLWFHYFDLDLGKDVVWNGVSWVPTLGGPQGTQGFQGYQGLQGSIGVQGSQGNQGFQGVAGAQGQQGSSGGAGPQGAQGVQGAQGAQGFQGPPVVDAGFKSLEGIAVCNSTESVVVGFIPDNVGDSYVQCTLSDLSGGNIPSTITMTVRRGGTVLFTQAASGSTEYISFIIEGATATAYTITIENSVLSYTGVVVWVSVLSGGLILKNGSVRGTALGEVISPPSGKAMQLRAWGARDSSQINNARYIDYHTLTPYTNPNYTWYFNGDTVNNPKGSFIINDVMYLIGYAHGSSVATALIDYNF